MSAAGVAVVMAASSSGSRAKQDRYYGQAGAEVARSVGNVPD